MRFALCRFVLDDPHEVSISQEQFKPATNAHDRMQFIVTLEEKFDAIARNYVFRRHLHVHTSIPVAIEL